METWHLLQSPGANAAANMAVDESLLRTAASRGPALLRLYSWSLPAVSIGYFQQYPAELAARYEIVRRPTGGGIVYHDADTTYTVVVPPGHALHKISTNDAYCAIHKAVARALEDRRKKTVVAGAASAPAPRGTYECFQNPVAGDVVTAGQKLAGGAQRRSRNGVLHQGSIAARVPADRLLAAFQQEFDCQFTPYQLTEAEQQFADQLAREKYSTAGWNEHSSRKLLHVH